ncbi:MAG: GNAT family N-acetyltransferase [bacterium]
MPCPLANPHPIPYLPHMYDIRPIPDERLDEFIRIVADAYPGLKLVTAEDRKKQLDKFIAQNKDVRNSTWGCYRDDTLLGGLRLHDYTMTLHGFKIPAGGGGYLAVDLAHKKEQVARELMLFFFRHFREQGAPMALLWPFRPDFYRKMGAGYGGKMHQYRVKPGHLPRGDSKTHVRTLTRDDLPALVECYNRYADRTTGMVEDTLIGRQIRFDDFPRFKWVGCERDGRIEGYIMFDFIPAQPATPLNNDLRVLELVFENPAALLELMSFLHSQADQINHVVISTPDDNFHHLLFDPRNDTRHLIPGVYHESHTSGVGIMYRTLSVPHLFESLSKCDFGGYSGTMKLNITDTFLPENGGNYRLRFDKGRPQLLNEGEADIAVSMDIADFSSLIIGSVDFKSLYTYSRAEVTPIDAAGIVDRIFAVDHKPVCMTDF